MLKLNLGCGPDKKEGYIGVDKVKLPTVDVVHDLNVYPYPFKDNSVDEIYCSHILEHLDDFIKTMEELWRICKPDALIIIKAPYYKHHLSYGDPTHKHFFTEHAFDVFSDTHPLSNFYSHARFRVLEKKLIPDIRMTFLPFKSFLNLFLWNIVREIEFKLAVNKDSNPVPLGDKGIPGERDDMFNPQTTGKGDRYKHLQRYRWAAKRGRRRILDIGCGTGYGTKILYDKGNEVYGVDNSEKAIEYAKKVYPGPKYVCCSAENLPFNDNFFDAITAFEVIEHVGNPEKALEEMYRILKKKGDLFISTPNPRHLGSILGHLLGRPYPENSKNIYHVKEFYYDEFVNFLKNRGFKIIFQYGQELRIWPWKIQLIIEKIVPFSIIYKLQALSGYYFPKYATTVVSHAKK